MQVSYTHPFSNLYVMHAQNNTSYMLEMARVTLYFTLIIMHVSNY